MSSANNKGRMSRRKKMEPWYYVGPIFLLPCDHVWLSADQERCDGIPEL